MRNIHKTLTDDIFRNCKYIYYLEEYLKTDNIKKTHLKQYNIMLDIFKTIIELKNILVADSDRTIADKITDLEISLEKCLFGELDNDSEKYKYSTRDIKGLTDKHTRYLYNKFKEWYEYLSNIGKLDFVEKEILNEMYRLENINFDDIVQKRFSFKKNKNSKYKIFICKFSRLFNDEKFAEEYKTNFEKYYGKMTEKDYNLLKSVYNLVASANNGITNKLYNITIRPLNDTDNAFSIFDIYLKSLNLSVPFSVKAELYLVHTLNCGKIVNNLEKQSNITYDDVANNFDLYNFIYRMELTNINDTNKDITTTIYKELTMVYKLYNQKEYEKALEITHQIIERNKDLFVRIS